MNRISSTLRLMLLGLLLMAGFSVKAQTESTPAGMPRQEPGGDPARYEAEKKAWIQQNPEQYKEMTSRRVEEKASVSQAAVPGVNPVQIVNRSWVESLSPEKQKIVRENPGMYRIVDDKPVQGSTTVPVQYAPAKSSRE